MDLNQSQTQQSQAQQPQAGVAGIPNLASLQNIPGMQNVQALQNMVEALNAQKQGFANQQIPQVPPAPAQNVTSSATAKKFDANEIQELAAIREAYEQITISFGQIEMQKREVTKSEKKINEKYVETEEREKSFLEKIVAKYGEGTFDINTGVFTPKS